MPPEDQFYSDFTGNDVTSNLGLGKSSNRFIVRNAYQYIVWVYSAVNAVAESISGVPFRFYEGRPADGNVIEDPEHYVNAAFSPPNEEVPSLKELIKMSFINLGLFGETFLWPDVKRKKGQVQHVDLWLKSAFLFQPVTGQDRLIGWKEAENVHNTAQIKRTYKLKEIAQLKYPNPYQKWRGMSPLSAGRLPLEQDVSMSRWNAGFFKGGLNNPFVILLKENLQPKQFEEFLKKLQSSFSGFVDGQLPLVLDGDAKAEKLMQSLKDLDFAKGKEVTREEILALFGVPPTLVGLFARATFTNSREQKKMFWQNTCNPKMEYFRDVFQLSILAHIFPGIYCDFDWSGIDALRDDPKDKADADYKKAQSVAIYAGLGYVKEDIATILDDPSLAVGDGELKPPTLDDEPKPPTEPEDEPDDVEEDNIISKISSYGIKVIQHEGSIFIKTTEEVEEEYSRLYNKNVLSVFEDRWTKFINSFFNEAAEEILRRQARGEHPLLMEAQWAGIWEDMSLPLVDSIFSEGMRRVVREIENPQTLLTSFGKLSPDLADILPAAQLEEIEKVIRALGDRTTGVAAGMIGTVNNAMAEAIAKSMTPMEMRDFLMNNVATLTASKAITIARTVSGSAYNAARYHGALAKGGKRHKWLSAGDGAVRDKHLLEHGNEVVIGQRFPVTGMKHPMDPSGRVEDIVNCRCTSYVTQVLTGPKRNQAVTTIPDNQPPDIWPTDLTPDQMSAILKENFNIQQLLIPGASAGVLKYGNIIGREFAKLFSNYPKLEITLREAGVLKAPGSKPLNTIEITQDEFIKEFVTSIYRSAESVIKIAVKTLPLKDMLTIGGWVVGKDLNTVLRHSYAHHVEKILLRDKALAEEWKGALKSIDAYLGEISYISTSAKSEAFAEAFAAYTSPLYKDSTVKLPAEVEVIMRRLLG